MSLAFASSLKLAHSKVIQRLVGLIVIFDLNELASAVFFFGDEGDIAKQLNIAEFEAVLDGFVPMVDLAGQTAKACYLDIDANLHVQRAVFFKLPVNQQGEIHKAWHLPLLDMATGASKAKDLGGGPIQLACYSQCPIAHFKQVLWDPDLSLANNQLLMIKHAVSENRLGLQFRQEQPEESKDLGSKADVEREISQRLRKEYAQEFRDHMAQLLKEQRLRMATSRTEFESESRQIKTDLDARVGEYQRLLGEKERVIEDLRNINSSFKETVDGQAQKISAMREYFDVKLEQAQSDGPDSMVGVREALEVELQAKFEANTKDLKETLQTREVELLYRNELEVQLHDEIARLRDENQTLVDNTGEQLLQKLIERGVSLVSFQPGAGHLTIPLSDIARYMDSPMGYAAEHCGVSAERYEQWLEHYRMPICQESLENGRLCGENINRVDAPLDFNAGESNSCTSCQKRKARPHLRLAGV